MKYAHNPNTHERMEPANSMKLSEKVPLFKQGTHLRDENARLLGYKSHPAYKLPYQIAESTD
jgi:metallopeptidase MepB